MRPLPSCASLRSPRSRLVRRRLRPRFSAPITHASARVLAFTDSPRPRFAQHGIYLPVPAQGDTTQALHRWPDHSPKRIFAEIPAACELYAGQISIGCWIRACYNPGRYFLHRCGWARAAQSRISCQSYRKIRLIPEHERGIRRTFHLF